MLRLQASVFTSVNWDDLCVPRRIKPYKVWTSSPKGLGMVCPLQTQPDWSYYSFLPPPCSQVWCGVPTSPHPSLSASHPQGQALGRCCGQGSLVSR